MSDLDPFDLHALAAAAHPDDELEAKRMVMDHHRTRFEQALDEGNDNDIMLGDDAATTTAVTDMLAKLLRAGGEVAQKKLDEKAAAKGGGKATTTTDHDKPSKLEQSVKSPKPVNWFDKVPRWALIVGGVAGVGLLGLLVSKVVRR